MLLASDYDKSKYFNGTSLDREKKFRIKITTEEVLTDKKGKQEKKLVVWFTNDERGLPLNKTNLRALKNAFGDDTADWKNKIIAMYPVMASNDMQGLRVKILSPKSAAAPSTQPAAPVGNGAAAAAPTPLAATPPPTQPASGNGAAAAAPPAAPAAVDPELEPDPPMSLTAEQDAELDDEIPEKW